MKGFPHLEPLVKVEELEKAESLEFHKPSKISLLQHLCHNSHREPWFSRRGLRSEGVQPAVGLVE